jgi:RimJ/RimL family protein N-acetyltransferase
MDEELEAAKERRWREVAAIDAAYARGELDDAGWHREMATLIVPAYVSASTLQGGSGHNGSEADWEWSRGVVAEGLHRSGTLLDVGCANGLMMESIARWSALRGVAIEPYGLEISPQLAGIARQRLPPWADRIFTGNVLGWKPPHRFQYVRTGLEYVPPARRRELVAWLLDEVLTPGGRLIIGKFNEEREQHAIEAALGRWGHVVSGRAERAHRSQPRVAYRCVWLDAPRLSFDGGCFRALRREDLPHLQRWLAAPHVAKWWRQSAASEVVNAEYIARIEGREPTYLYVIEHAGRAIGFIQWAHFRDYPEHALRIGAGSGAAAIDLAIGELDAVGRGLGSRVIRAFVEQVVFDDPNISTCITDPEQDNTRSLRAFAKAGFKHARTIAAAPGESPRCVVERARSRVVP